MNCGLCGGAVRDYSGVLYGRPIKDWKHATVPPGTEPHRPVLGTPVPLEVLDRIHRSKTESSTPITSTVVEEVPPPLVPPRPATADELADSQSATQIVRLLADEGWELMEPPVYFKAASGVEYLIVRGRRRDLGAVVSWRRRPNKGVWELEDGYRLARGLTRQVGSEQLKDWIRQRNECCPDCGRSSVVHEGGECP